MSSKQEASKAEHKTKKFGKSERNVPHHTQKAKKFYPAEDEAKPRKVRDLCLLVKKKVLRAHESVSFAVVMVLRETQDLNQRQSISLKQSTMHEFDYTY